MRKDLHEANRLSWNAATVAHNSHKGDQAAFFRAGGSTVWPEELELLGDIQALDLLHLQCNAGQDTLSLAKLGARVTGVDISDEAIAFAQRLSEESGIPGRFERADVYNWLEEAAREGRTFDRVFSSYGAICWLSDLETWAQGIAAVLKPGGRFVLLEFHPIPMLFDEKWQPFCGYFNSDPIEEPGVGDYVALSGDGLTPNGYETGIENFQNPHKCYDFLWGIGEVVTALIKAGLRIEQLTEYPYATGWRGFEDMRDVGGRRFAPPETVPHFPMMFGIVASRS